MDILSWYYQRRMLNALVQNSFNEADRYLTKLIGRKGTSLGLLYNQALILLGKGEPKQAYQVLLDTVDIYGESLRLCRLLGDIAYGSGRREDAFSWYSKAEEDNPLEKERRFIRIRLGILSNPSNYAKVMTLLPTMPAAHSLMESDPNKAFQIYTDLIEYDPTQVEALNNLGVLELERFKQPEKAQAYFARVLSLVDHQGAARNLAKARKYPHK